MSFQEEVLLHVGSSVWVQVPQYYWNNKVAGFQICTDDTITAAMNQTPGSLHMSMPKELLGKCCVGTSYSKNIIIEIRQQFPNCSSHPLFVMPWEPRSGGCEGGHDAKLVMQ